MIRPPIAPVITVSFISFFAPSLASSSLFSPIIFPSRIPPALAIPKQSMVPKFLTTITNELAATASVPRCPIITEYMENATLQDISFPKAGKESLTKSAKSILFFTNRYLKSSLISLLKQDTTKHASNCTSLDADVAIATPIAPSFGAPNSPKMNTAFKNIFKEKANTFIAVLITTLPTLLKTAR
ncbi:hypothetical protein IMSAGC002_04731 [Lachnospiraceae bacterium]|nr:hypothetical protein IMSAGC002_04731 [Lachnospiraceae bacterium]